MVAAVIDAARVVEESEQRDNVDARAGAFREPQAVVQHSAPVGCAVYALPVEQKLRAHVLQEFRGTDEHLWEVGRRNRNREAHHLPEACLQIGRGRRRNARACSVGQRYTFTARAASIVFLRSCLSKTHSDGVSILDTKEISCFAFREALEAVAKDCLPPIFDCFAMFSPEVT